MLNHAYARRLFKAPIRLHKKQKHSAMDPDYLKLCMAINSARYNILKDIIDLVPSYFPYVDAERVKTILTKNGYFYVQTVKTITTQEWEAMDLGREAFPILLTIAHLSDICGQKFY